MEEEGDGDGFITMFPATVFCITTVFFLFFFSWERRYTSIIYRNVRGSNHWKSLLSLFG